MKIPRELKVGILAIIAIVLLILGLNYLKGRSVLNSTTLVYAYYDNINGLTNGNKVLYKGYQVGQVEKIEIDNSTGKIKVTISIFRKFDLPKDSKATIVALDILGLKGIEIKRGTSTQYLVNGDQIQDSVAVGMMERVEKELMPTKGKIDDLLVNVNKVTGNLNNTLFGPDAKLKGIVDNLNKTSENVAAVSAELSSTIKTIQQTADKVQDLLAIINDNKGNIDKTFGNAAALTDSLKFTISQLRQGIMTSKQKVDDLLTQIQKGDGTVGKLLSDKQLYDNLVKSSEDLDKLLIDLREKPSRYVHFSIFGKKDK